MQDVNATIVRCCQITMLACNCDQTWNNKNPIWGTRRFK